MASRKRVAAPPNRVYKSSMPLKQLKFSEPKKRVTYGKQTSKRISKSDQDTLTQMDFVKLMQQSINEDDVDWSDNDDAAKKRQNKRRKTVENQPSSDSKFHTQTLTQIDHWSSTAAQEDEDDNIFGVPSSPRSLGHQCRNARTPSIVKPTMLGPSGKRSTQGNMGPPQTPHKVIKQEIPSSQSPETPLSSHSRTSARRSPLREKSTNAHIPFALNPKAVPSRYSSPQLKIEDTFETATESPQSHIPMTSSKRSSPVKSVRFQVPGDDPEAMSAWPSVNREHSQAVLCPKLSVQAHSKLEILDSDAESELDDQEDGYIPREKQNQGEEPETFYGNIGCETQMAIENLLRLPHIEASQIVDDQPIEGDLGSETQFMESQRLSTQHLNSMAARTGDSDVFISMHPQNVSHILDQTKDHEFRPWRLPPTVSRIWMYETAPTSMLKYMAVIGPEKQPTEIKNEDGVGNAGFNSKPSHNSDYAYEILELYELADPLPWAQLYDNEWLKTPPSKWNWVRPAVVDRLMANLMPPLFIRSTTIHNVPASSFTDTQEADAQLLSTLLQFTEPTTLAQPCSSQNVDKTVSCEELSFLTTRRESTQGPRPSQASTASFIQSQTPSSQILTDVVWESPSRPVLSSTPLQLQLPTLNGQDYHEPELNVPYSLASSQLLTKSQMLPASLFSDSVPGPPLFMQDSDEEED